MFIDNVAILVPYLLIYGRYIISFTFNYFLQDGHTILLRYSECQKLNNSRSSFKKDKIVEY